jgi:hypothetical protein
VATSMSTAEAPGTVCETGTNKFSGVLAQDVSPNAKSRQSALAQLPLPSGLRTSAPHTSVIVVAIGAASLHHAARHADSGPNGRARACARRERADTGSDKGSARRTPARWRRARSIVGIGFAALRLRRRHRRIALCEEYEHSEPKAGHERLDSDFRQVQLLQSRILKKSSDAWLSFESGLTAVSAQLQMSTGKRVAVARSGAPCSAAGFR